MCGIFGIAELGSQKIDARLQAMADATVHRGPDDTNWVSFASKKHAVGYGINRLSIIDVAGGRQPISNESETVDVVLNGEIYNYLSLRRDLEARGHVFKTKSDTEVIVHLYEEFGRKCVEKLRGMFAFALFDKKAQMFFIARDHIGIKPLYYLSRKNQILFCSELKGIAAAAGRLDINPRAIGSYLTYRYVMGPETIYTGVQSLPAGHTLTYHLPTDQVSIEQWWALTYRRVNDSYDAAKANLRSLLRESVKLRLQSEVPLGAFLSGGVDSSVICAMVAKELGSEINVYNIGYRTAQEYDYAYKVSRDLGFHYYQVEVTLNDMVDSLDDVIHHMDQPLSDAACFPSLYLSRIVKRAVTVMLSGEGADELFTGYWQYDQMLATRQPSDVSNAAYLDHLRRSSYFPDQRNLIPPRNRKQLGNPVQECLKWWDGPNSLQARLTYFDLHTWLPDDLLMKIDKMTMAASVEARVPFLDPKVIEYAYGLPDRYKYQDGVTKRILKDLAEDLGVPRDVVRRPKMGFTVPIHDLLQGPFRSRFLDKLRSGKFRRISYLDHGVLSDTVGRYYSGSQDLALFCWMLFILAEWVDRA